jgi:hypothetical protein
MIKVRNIVIGLIASALVVGVVVSCGGGGGGGGSAATYSVGGSLAGATGNVALKLNGGSDMTAANGNFTFPNMLGIGATFNVQIAAPNQACTVANGTGAIGAANVTNVSITCGAQTTQTVVRSTVLTGALQNPPVTTSATGVGGVIVDPATKAITGGITFSGLTPTMQHIHQAPSGNPTADGSVIIGLTLASDGQTAVVPVGTVLTQAQYDALLAGELYFNVHTVANSGGEIRGQITAQGGLGAATAALTNAQEVPASTSAAAGTGTLIFDRATRNILITYITHNVTNATMAHIHTSPSGAGSNGNVIVGFSTLTPNFDTLGNNLAFPPAGSQVPAANVADFAANYLYFNVHSTNNLCAPAADCGAGEIRGNITALP